MNNITLLPRGSRPQHVVAGQKLGAKKVNEIIDAISNPLRLRGLAFRDTGSSGVDLSLFAFGVYAATNDDEDAVWRVNAGKVRLGVGHMTIAQKDFLPLTELTSNTEWIYVQHTYFDAGESGPIATIEHASTEPSSTSSSMKVPLVKLTATTPGIYSVASICHIGDIVLAAPLM